jgi:hypothetical protein
MSGIVARLTVLHIHAADLVAAIPACETMSVDWLVLALRVVDCAVSLVNVESSHATWAGVQVFVCTPNGEIDVPVVQLKGNVPNCMSKIPSNY